MKKIRLWALAIAAVGYPAWAQTNGPELGPPPPPMGLGSAPGGMGGGPGGLRPMGMGMRGKVVAGAPYSADVNTSMTQTLADGNIISHASTGHVARDSQGRTYFQQNISVGPWAAKAPTSIVFLSDPVAGYTYVLNPNYKTAMRREFRSRSADGAPRPPRGSARADDSRQRVETDLGQQDISGLAATGKSITRTIPAGSMGNAQAIVEKSEVWTSQELQVVVMAKHSDPRSGQSTYSLSNIQRNEPPATLFQVPAGYSVQDAPQHGRPW